MQMAIWQFSFYIIPEKAFAQKYNTNIITINQNDSDLIRNWGGNPLSDSSISKISETLQHSQSWSNNIQQFGSPEETCIELFYEGSILSEVFIRLDLRSLTQNLLSSVMDFIKSNNALILTLTGTILNPIAAEVIEEMKKSDAYSFVKNPREFIVSFSN